MMVPFAAMVILLAVGVGTGVLATVLVVDGGLLDRWQGQRQQETSVYYEIDNAVGGIQRDAFLRMVDEVSKERVEQASRAMFRSFLVEYEDYYSPIDVEETDDDGS